MRWLDVTNKETYEMALQMLPMYCDPLKENDENQSKECKDLWKAIRDFEIKMYEKYGEEWYDMEDF